jgi:hypothetical protein
MGSICREWHGARTRNGYGIRRPGRWGSSLVHRQVWEMAHGPIPAGLLVLHSCDNRACYLLAHLHLGTPADNSAEMVARGRSSLIAEAHRLPDDAPCGSCGLPRSRRSDGRLRCLPCHAAYNRGGQ